MKFRIDLKIFILAILFFITNQIKIYAMIMLFAIIHEFGHLLAGILLGMKPTKIEIKPFGVAIDFDITRRDYTIKIKKGNLLEIKKIFVAFAGPFTNGLIIIMLILFNKIYFDDYDIFFLGTRYNDVIDDVNSKKDISLEKFGNAVSEPSRIKILQFILEQGEITCKDLERAFSFSGSTAYHHITTLVRIGLVNSRSEGKAVFYSINREYFKKVTELLNKFVIG